MKTKQKVKNAPKNNKYPYSCSHFQFHLDDQDPETINAKLQLQQISSALDNYQQKQSSSHLRLFTMHDEGQRSQSWKSNTQRNLFQSQNLQKKRVGKVKTKTNYAAVQEKRIKKYSRQQLNYCNSKQIKINLSFNNIQPTQEFADLKFNQIKKIIKKTRPFSQKKEQFRKIVNLQVDKKLDDRIHSHSYLNIVQKLKSNFLSTSIYQFNQQDIGKQTNRKSEIDKGEKSAKHFHQRVLSQPYYIKNCKSKQKECSQKLALNIEPFSQCKNDNYSTSKLQKTKQLINSKVPKASRLNKTQNSQLFKRDNQLKQDFQQLKRILQSENQNVLSLNFHFGIMSKYSRKNYKRQKIQNSKISKKA